MRTIAVDDEVFSILQATARIAGCSPNDALRRLLGLARSRVTGPQELRVRGNYKGHGVEASVFLDSGKTVIVSGALAGKEFNSPSAAASTFVRSCNPSRHAPQTNGLRFWRREGTNEPLADYFK